MSIKRVKNLLMNFFAFNIKKITFDAIINQTKTYLK
jgi:hypothetical protein